MSIYATWFAVTHSHRQIYIIAPTLDQSRIIFNEISYHFQNGPLAALVVGKVNEYPFPRIRLANGSEIHGRGANSPQFLRGKKCHLAIVDEAAFCKDETLTNVIEPMFTVTGQSADAAMILISTPFGLGTFYDFVKSAQDEDDTTSIYHHYPSESNPHADVKFLKRVRERYGEDSLTWRTEYLAEFVDDDMAVFPARQIKAAYERYPYRSDDNYLFPYAPQSNHRYVSGVDLANVRDYFVQTILDVSDPALVPLVNMVRTQKRGYTYYKQVIREQRAAYNSCEVLVDATSLGESVVEDLADISAEGYKFSQQSKYEIVSELSRMFQEGRICIPYDRDIISELNNFAYEITKSKGLKMQASKGHDDIVMSLALAAHLALIPRSLGVFQGVDLRFTIPQVPKFRSDYDPFKALFADEEGEEWAI